LKIYIRNIYYNKELIHRLKMDDKEFSIQFYNLFEEAFGDKLNSDENVSLPENNKMTYNEEIALSKRRQMITYPKTCLDNLIKENKKLKKENDELKQVVYDDKFIQRTNILKNLQKENEDLQNKIQDKIDDWIKKTPTINKIKEENALLKKKIDRLEEIRRQVMAHLHTSYIQDSIKKLYEPFKKKIESKGSFSSIEMHKMGQLEILLKTSSLHKIMFKA